MSTITGSAGANTIYGTVADDILDGADGNDFLVGGSGNDWLLGGEGNDWLYGDWGGDPAGGDDRLEGGAGDDQLLGISGNDLLYGGSGNDILNGGTGNDRLYGGDGVDGLYGGEGDDFLSGGAGNDVYDVDSVGDVVVEAAGAGIDTVQTTLTSYTLGANLENLVYTGSGTFVGRGNALDNTLEGGSGSNRLIGGDGNDIYVVKSTSDVVVELAGGGTDFIATTLSSFTLNQANIEGLRYTGSGSFVGRGDARDNILQGGSGSNRLIGGDGNDNYVAVSTRDVFIETATGGVDTVETQLSSFTLPSYVENLTYKWTPDADDPSHKEVAFVGLGNALNNVLSGGRLSDTLSGGAGNDVLMGGLGTNRLIGGSGNDSYKVVSATDVIVEAAGEGEDSVVTALSRYALAANVEGLTYTGRGSFVGIGNASNNTLRGGAGSDRLTGGAGNDTLDGRAGADTMSGGAGNDLYEVDASGDVVVEVAHAGIDTVRTTLAAYTLGDNLENLVFRGTKAFRGAGNGLDNTLAGASGNDILTGGGGNDVLNGGAGQDRMTGGTGNDVYVVDAVGDVVVEAGNAGMDTVRTTLTTCKLGSNVENLSYLGAAAFEGMGNSLNNVMAGGAGDDVMGGAAGNDYLSGNGGRDRLLGGGGDDSLLGGRGDDSLYGGDGSDWLIGGAGKDLLSGAVGADSFVFTSRLDSGPKAFDTISDFSAEEGDRIDLSAIDANAIGGSSHDSFVYVGSSAFSGTAGQLRFSNGMLTADVNGDRIADFAVKLSGVDSLSASSILL